MEPVDPELVWAKTGCRQAQAQGGGESKNPFHGRFLEQYVEELEAGRSSYLNKRTPTAYGL